MKNKQKFEEVEEFHSSLHKLLSSGMSKEALLEKYENVLASREKQLQDLSLMIGNYNEKLADVNNFFIKKLSDSVGILKNEKEELENKLAKYVFLSI